MIFSRRFLIVVVCTIAVLTMASCSSVQNREKKKSSTTVNGAEISVQVSARSTTTGSQTTTTFDPKIEKVITKTLSKVLIVGASASTLFSPTAIVHAADAFPDNHKATKNSVSVAYSYMASTNANESLVVAEITQTVTSKGKAKQTRTGKIFFDTTGIILGYEFPNATETTTTVPKA